MINHRHLKLVFIIFTICFWVAMFMLNKIFPLFLDDWVYSMVWYDLPGTPGIKSKLVSNVSDIIISQYNHYMKWGGRSVVHAIAQFLLMINPYLKYVLNASAYIFFVYLTYLYCKKKGVIQNEIYAIVFCSSFMFVPDFTDTILWTTGVANYLWGALLLLLFIYPYFKYLQGEAVNIKSRIAISLFGCYGIVAGWTNENTATSVLCILFMLLCYLKIKKNTIPSWALVGYIGLAVGTTIMILAPGNFFRLNLYQHSTPLLLTMHIGLKNIYHIYKQSVITPLSIFFIILFVIEIFRGKLKKTDRITFILLFAIAHMSIIVMLPVQYFPMRATFFATSLIIIASVKIWNNFSISYKFMLNILICSILIVFTFSTYMYRYKHIYEFNEFMKRRISYIETQKSKGNLDIVVTEKLNMPKELNINDISTDTAFWENVSYKAYFQINSIRLKN